MYQKNEHGTSCFVSYLKISSTCKNKRKQKKTIISCVCLLVVTLVNNSLGFSANEKVPISVKQISNIVIFAHLPAELILLMVNFLCYVLILKTGSIFGECQHKEKKQEPYGLWFLRCIRQEQYG